MSKLNYRNNLKSTDRINDQILGHPFTDYWDIFVLKHQNPMNIALHILGIFYFFGLIFYVWRSQNFWLLLGLPLTQVLGLTGHLLFERSHIDLQDSVFSWRACYCLGKMFWRVLMGKYQDDIQKRKTLLHCMLNKTIQ